MAAPSPQQLQQEFKSLEFSVRQTLELCAGHHIHPLYYERVFYENNQKIENHTRENIIKLLENKSPNERIQITTLLLKGLIHPNHYRCHIIKLFPKKDVSDRMREICHQDLKNFELYSQSKVYIDKVNKLLIQREKHEVINHHKQGLNPDNLLEIQWQRCQDEESRRNEDLLQMKVAMEYQGSVYSIKCPTCRETGDVMLPKHVIHGCSGKVPENYNGDKTVCVVCMEKWADVFFAHCGHNVMCQGCVEHMSAQEEQKMEQ
jgi:hypothetical protein